MHALVIDDSGTSRRLIARFLGELGFAVQEANDGAHGLVQLAAMPRPDVVMVDWNMPVLDGLGFVQALRADRAYDAVPLVMVTTAYEKTRVAAALAAGANEYVMKPFDREMLADKLALLGLLGV